MTKMNLTRVFAGLMLILIGLLWFLKVWACLILILIFQTMAPAYYFIRLGDFI